VPTLTVARNDREVERLPDPEGREIAHRQHWIARPCDLQCRFSTDNANAA
jgi:hypothetical protein